jgi:hypothetical protein
MPGLARKGGIDTVAAPDGTPGTICPSGLPRCDNPSTQATDEGSSTVFVGNPPYGVVRFGDKMTGHTTIPCGCPVHIPPMVVCSSFVYVEGKRLARQDDEYVADGIYHPISSSEETVVDGSPKS